VEGSLQGLEDDLGAGLLIAVEIGDDLLDLLGSVDISASAAEDDAFLDCRLGGVEGIFHTELGFLHLGLGRCADADDCDAAGELGQTLLELLTVEIGLGLFDLLADLGNTLIEGGLVAEAVDDDSLFLGDLDALGAAELLKGCVLELETQVGADDGTAGQDGDILQHGFTSVAIAGSLDSDNIEGAAELVDDQGGQSLALDILSDDEELGAHLDDLLQQRQDILDRGDLLICDQDEGILEVCLHLVHIGCHVGADVASVELHAFDQVQLGLHGLGLFDRDDAVLGDLLHGVRDHSADLLVTGGDSRDLLDVVLALDGSAHLFDGLDSSVSGLAHTLAQNDGVGACCQVLHAFIDHGLCQDSCGGGAVARDIIGLGGDFLDELCAHVLESILELDLLGDRHAIVGDGRSAVGLVQNNVSALGSQGDLDCIRKLVDTFRQCHACICAVFEFLSHCIFTSKNSFPGGLSPG